MLETKGYYELFYQFLNLCITGLTYEKLQPLTAD
jgi:hypothetical protein